MKRTTLLKSYGTFKPVKLVFIGFCSDKFCDRLHVPCHGQETYINLALPHIQDRKYSIHGLHYICHRQSRWDR